MRKKVKFIKLLQVWGIILLVGLGGSIIALDIVNSNQDFNFRANQIRTDYIDQQKRRIKQEVKRVVDRIHYEKAQSEIMTKRKIKSRTLEACAIAENIYQENKGAKSNHEIQQIIRDALRPVRFENGSGYYFAASMDGVEQLYPVRPELEGKNLIGLQDYKGNFVIRDEINVIKKSGEGFVEDFWPKPGENPAKAYQKISFVKYFKPLDWYFGTGLYVDDVENQIKADLLSSISRIRFGTEGYIFVNRLNGDALVSNGKLVSETKKLWEVFNKNPEKTKALFDKEHNAALKAEGDYIYYSLIKLTNPNKEAPKVSFIYGIPEWQWLVGTGVYLDDVETVIAMLQAELNNHIKAKTLYFAMITMGLVAFLLLLSSRLNRRLKNDFNLFISFFNKAALSDEPINRDKVRFDELDRMAENANKMLADRRQAVKEQQENEQQLFSIYETVGDLIFLLKVEDDNQYRFISVNRAFLTVTGLSQEMVVDRTVNEVIPEPSLTMVLGKYRQAMEENHIVRWEETSDYPTGRLTGEVSVAPVFDDQGKCTHLVGSVHDISERKQAEEALRESEEKYRNILESIEDVYFEVDLAGNLIFGNKSLYRISGYTADELKARNYRQYVDEKNAKEIYRIFNEVFKTGKTARAVDLDFLKKDGSTSVVEILVSLIKEEDGKPAGFRGIARDIAERKKAEDEKADLERQLRQAQKMETVGRLAGGVAHDFNNLLSVIFGNAELAMDEVKPGDPLQKNLQEILNASRRSANVVRQLLAFARKQTIAPMVFDLNDSLEGMLKMLRRLIGEDIDLVWLPGAGLYPVKMDPSQLDQILVNLCVNARDAIVGVGKVTIETENASLDKAFCADHPGSAPGEFVLLVVSDNGCGMEKEILDNIFDPFFTTKDVDKGTGLGLATVYGIVKQNNGFINVYSEPGKGTTINIYLPRHESKAVKRIIKSKAEIPQGRGEVILVVEDDLLVLKLAEKNLKGLGYTVLAAGTTQEAMSMAEAHSGEIDLLVTDVIMPEMNGRELAQQLKSFYPDIRCMFMSGYTADIIADRGVLNNGEHFIQKPFSKKDLAIAVRKALDEAKDSAQG